MMVSFAERVGSIGAIGFGTVAGFVAFLVLAFFLLNLTGPLNLVTTVILLAGAFLAGRFTHGAVKRRVARLPMIASSRAAEEARVVAATAATEAEAQRRAGEWEADRPRREAEAQRVADEWEADRPRREAEARDTAAQEATIRREMETRQRIANEVAQADYARQSAANVSSMQGRLAAAVYSAERVTGLPEDLRGTLYMKTQGTILTEWSISYLEGLVTSLAQLGPELHGPPGPRLDAAIAEARFRLA